MSTEFTVEDDRTILASTARHPRTALIVILLHLSVCSQTSAAEPVKPPDDFRQLSETHCNDCHTGADAEARLDFELLVEGSIADHLSAWRRTIRVLDKGTMPPKESNQPPAELRSHVVGSLAASLRDAIQAAAADPGPTIVRRLTNAEYDYCIEDLTSLNLDLGDQLISDSVGGSGFTSSSTAQFMQDANLERYLEAAKIVADHAMIGAGPIYFYSDPGQTGMELSAMQRIQQLYRRHGFRSSAGEGAKPYGLNRFSKAFHVAWRYRYRHEIARSDATLEQLAEEFELEPKFARHVWRVLHTSAAKFPLSDIIETWEQFPRPNEISGDVETTISRQADELYDRMRSWQARFAGSASDEEEAALLTSSDIEVPSSVQFAARALRKQLEQDDNFTPDLNNPDLFSEDGRIRFKLTIEPASGGIEPGAVVIFSNLEFRFRFTDVIQPDPVPLQSVIEPSVIEHLAFGNNAGGERITENEFVVRVGESKVIEVELPDESRRGELIVTARLDRRLGRDTVLRCTIQDTTSDRGRQYSSLLRDRESVTMDRWEAGLEQFASALPQISHREPAPSDRDPIPAPYENTYNLPERNFFHTAVKYYREDAFLTQHMIPDAAGRELDVAWTDLLTSFDYHQVNLRFVANKYGVDIADRTIDAIDRQWIESLPDEVRRYVSDTKSQYDAMQSELHKAEKQHLQDIVNFASRAWRRRLTTQDIDGLKRFYESSRSEHQLSHRDAIRTAIVRVLVSPDFLYRIERAADGQQPTTLTDYELASRLSFSIWSSLPDEELLLFARDEKLSDPEVLSAQVERMLRSPKSRRLATEFFGQWLGFYQFDRFRGVDVGRFPEFDDRLRRSLYDEAISFFQYIVREDRPYSEILYADYTFVDETAARHYGIPWTPNEDGRISRRIETLSNDRGGLFSLGAVLATTSAPLRTSPVKRGDWIMRRLLGTPVPPPPADAGSIAAEEVSKDGRTVRDRLEAHRTQPECMNCHIRIDPLGFALENFDSLGRWRETYLDNRPIDASGTLSGGDTIRGVAGLKEYMRKMDDSFRRTLATKLVGYVMGRAESASDSALIERIAVRWRDDSRFSVALMTIVQSPQFRRIRGKQGMLNEPVSVSPGAVP